MRIPQAARFQGWPIRSGNSASIEFLDQLRRGAVIPPQLFAPLLGLVGQQRAPSCAGRQLAQIDNLHGTGTQSLARSVHNHFYHIIR